MSMTKKIWIIEADMMNVGANQSLKIVGKKQKIMWLMNLKPLLLKIQILIIAGRLKTELEQQVFLMIMVNIITGE